MNLFNRFLSDKNKIKKLNAKIKDNEDTINHLKNIVNYLRRKNNSLIRENNLMKDELNDYRNINKSSIILPSECGTKVYWITNSITNRNMQNEAIIMNDDDIGVVELTIYDFIVRADDNGNNIVYIRFKEAINMGSFTFIISLDEIGKSLFFDKNEALNIFNNLGDHMDTLGWLFN